MLLVCIEINMFVQFYEDVGKSLLSHNLHRCKVHRTWDCEVLDTIPKANGTICNDSSGKEKELGMDKAIGKDKY